MTDTRTEAERLRSQGIKVETIEDILKGSGGASQAPLDSARLGPPPTPPEPGIGHNNPPPFEQIKSEIDDLVMEARNWLDGSGVENEEQASAVAALRDQLRAAAKRAEELRKAEAKPFDDGKAEVQARYNPLIAKDRGVCDLAIQTCNNVLRPYLQAIEAAQRAEAERLQREALEAASVAQRAAQAAAQSTDMSVRESAEELISQAKGLIGTAKRADAAKPQVHGGTRAVGMKSVWTPELTDPAAALAHYRQEQPARLKEFLLELARTDVRSGKRSIPGFAIKEDRIPV